MGAFDPDAWQRDPPDLRLLAPASVRLFWRRTVLDETTTWLRRDGYQVTELDAARWLAASDLHDAFADAFDFPEHYGRNLDALADCLGEVATYGYGSSPAAAGLVLTLHRYDTYASADPDTAGAVLDIFAGAARTGLLIGHRMLCLVQSDDPEIAFPPVGATPVLWNDEERRTADRHP